jgi:hypothetical protein
MANASSSSSSFPCTPPRLHGVLPAPSRTCAGEERGGGGASGRGLSATSSIDRDGNHCGGDGGDEVQWLHEDELEAEAAEELVIPISI